MSVDLLRALARIHGVVAWLATAALVIAAWALTRSTPAPRASAPAPRAPLTACASALGLLGACAAVGLAMHDAYRSRLRQRLFLDSPALGWLFERKQHFAFGAVLLACAGLAALLGARRIARRPADADVARDLSSAARLAFTASALLALTASIASVIVARRASF